MSPRLLAAFAATVLLSVPVLARAPQKIVAERSQIRFSFTQMNVPIEGRFRAFDAVVTFNPKRPEATKARFEVDLASIDLGNAEGETEARRKPWLHVESFPKAEFIASSVKATGPGKYVAEGPLTIKGHSQVIAAPFTVSDSGGFRTVEGQFPLKRLQFRIGEGAWADTDTVADEVRVRFRFVIPSPK